MNSFLNTRSRDVFIVGGTILAVFLTLWLMNKEPSVLPRASITLGSVSVSVEIASTGKARTQGLSGRANLREGEGMLFVFDTPARHSFWMKEMNFPIDIIWISETGAIVSWEEHASPASYPGHFTPSGDALYVLEVPAGFVEKHSISPENKMIIPPDVL